MTGRLSKHFHGVGIGPLSKILAVKVLIVFVEEIKQFDEKYISHGWMIIEYLIHSYSLFSCSIVLQSTESKLNFHVSRCMGELCYIPI